MLESVQTVVRAISRYALLELIYCESVTSDASLQLQNNIISVYSAILVFLCKAKKYFQQNSARMLPPNQQPW
jgi:DNA phosphorothioation-dependent restriction protein DptG